MWRGNQPGSPTRLIKMGYDVKSVGHRAMLHIDGLLKLPVISHPGFHTQKRERAPSNREAKATLFAECDSVSERYSRGYGVSTHTCHQNINKRFGYDMLLRACVPQS